MTNEDTVRAEFETKLNVMSAEVARADGGTADNWRAAYRARDAVLAAFDAARVAPPAGVEGWRLVPIEPNEQQLQTAYAWMDNKYRWISIDAFRAAYEGVVKGAEASSYVLAAAPPQVEQQHAAPVAYVPVHPRSGPLWANTIEAARRDDADRPRYPLMSLYAAPPQVEQQGREPCPYHDRENGCDRPECEDGRCPYESLETAGARELPSRPVWLIERTDVSPPLWLKAIDGTVWVEDAADARHWWTQKEANDARNTLPTPEYFRSTETEHSFVKMPRDPAPSPRAEEAAPTGAVIDSPVVAEGPLTIARTSALLHAGDHAYLPATREAADNWRPHDWVVDALQIAYQEGYRARALRPAVASTTGDHWRALLATLIDIYDDAYGNGPEDRCYVEGAYTKTLDECRDILKHTERSAPCPPIFYEEAMTALRALAPITTPRAEGGSDHG